MSLGAVAYKVGGTRQCSGTRKEVSMATLLAAPTRHRHTELFSGILTNQYILGPELWAGGLGKKFSTKNGKHATKLWQRHFVTNCKQATAYTSHEVPLLKASGQP